MYPILFKLGPLTIHTYGFLVALGFIAGVTLGKKLSSRSGIHPDRFLDFAFIILLSGFIGARVLYVFTRFSYFLEDPIAVFKVWEGGLVFFGGLIFAAIVGVWY